MANGIVVTPDVLRSKAEELKRYKTDHDDVIKRISSLVENLPSEFKGDAASAYIEKFNEMKLKFPEFSENLWKLADNLEKSANRIEQADKEAALNNSK